MLGLEKQILEELEEVRKLTGGRLGEFSESWSEACRKGMNFLSCIPQCIC